MRRALILLLLGLASEALAQPSPGVPEPAPPPAVLEALAEAMKELEREDEQRRAEAGEGRFAKLEQAWTRQVEASEAAVNSAIAAEAAGAAPGEALRAISSLEGRSPLLPRLMAQLQTVSPRTFAYSRVVSRWDPEAPAEGPRASKALALAAAAAWEAELAGMRQDPIIQVEVATLADAYARLGELAAARRVADLDPREGPLARLDVLTAARAWDEAADLAGRTNVDEVAAVMMRQEQLERAYEKAERSPAEARLAALLPSLDAGPDPAGIRQVAQSHLEQGREDLLKAARRWADAATAKRVEARLSASKAR